MNPTTRHRFFYNLVNTELAVEGLRFARFSSLYVEKADFFKLDNLTISKSIVLNKEKRMSQLNISLTGQNLFTITKYTGSDPEPALLDSVTFGASALAPGIDRRTNYLPGKSIILGIDFNF